MLSPEDIPSDLESLSKEELISILERLALRNVKTCDKAITKNKLNKDTKFDFKKYKKRHVALKFLYLGWDYSGFAVQTNTVRTIEGELFKALERTKLLESRETSNYNRCGRTDKGVSAFSQVISVDLRSSVSEGKGVITPEDFVEDKSKYSSHEINYTAILNRVLPPEIRVLAWAPVEKDFSARFDCKQRTYKYWFPVANLDIECMEMAGRKLIGEHDFRNICKMDVENGVFNYRRKILNVYIKRLNYSDESSYNLAELTVVGQAFLYHQIRCLVSLLFLVGQKKEDPEIIDTLLDVQKCPSKPQYKMASEFPLVLYDCSYENVQWMYDKNALQLVIKSLQNAWTQHAVKTAILRSMLSDLEGVFSFDPPPLHLVDCLVPGVKTHVYKRLLERECCVSLEEKIERLNKKQKVKSVVLEASSSKC